ITVRDYRAPELTGSATPNEINAGDRASIALTPQITDCNGRVIYSCKADEGTVSSGPPFEFNSTGVAFDMTDRSRPQTKVVNVSWRAADGRGASSSATIPVTVNLAALGQAQRFDDVIFPAGSARVNNCGKRILLEEVYPLLAQHPDWDLVIVGHTATGERA